MAGKIVAKVERCIGCKACELACAVAHSTKRSVVEVVLAGELPKKRIQVHQVPGKKVPLNCNHCTNATCIDYCITGAMHRRNDGIVTNEDGPSECNGCWMCIMSCPFGAIIQDEETHKPIKCDQNCLRNHKIPRCVQACPTKALLYWQVDDLKAQAIKNAKNKIDQLYNHNS
ncbi:4Fe-4S binding protein [Heliobacterium chlorum]|uniref:4Fe-4S binding protein n=1 Tax=Heliobacterium chlorum TaxID=2698 RepID=A0ABR7T072_HELCL|nr:4Fe-4S dicluster domain-containing protein [Heliobacterium chlorum]MBC9783582.1 4Fe-4S binding protein [Heliobacterium chlorum]